MDEDDDNSARLGEKQPAEAKGRIRFHRVSAQKPDTFFPDLSQAKVIARWNEEEGELKVAPIGNDALRTRPDGVKITEMFYSIPEDKANEFGISEAFTRDI